MKKYKFTFWNGQIFVGAGINHLDVLRRLGLQAYNPVAYDYEEIEDANIPPIPVLS